MDLFFILFFQSYLEQAHIDKVEGAFSTVDVDSVDMYKFPGLQTIPYYKVLMEPGDCLFIPSRWVVLTISFVNPHLTSCLAYLNFGASRSLHCGQPAPR